MSAATVGTSRAGAGRTLGVQLLLWAYAGIAFGPLLLVLLGSMRSNRDIVRDPLGLPTNPTFDNYGRAWATASLSTYLFNSVLICVVSVALCTAVSLMAAYPLARYSFPGRPLAAAYVLSGLMLPIKLGVLPIFYMFQAMGLIDSRIGLILLYAASGIPFSVFILMAFLRGLPNDVEEAARVDGASELRLLLSVVTPLTRPAIATVAVFQFASTWNDFFFPLVLLRSSEKYPIPVGLSRFFGEFSTDRGALYAGLVMAVIPLLAVFLIASRQIVAGLTAGISK